MLNSHWPSRLQIRCNYKTYCILFISLEG